MFLLAGMMGVMAVGAAALWGLEDVGNREEDGSASDAPEALDDPGSTEAATGPSIADIATGADDPEGDDWMVQSGDPDADMMTGTALNDFLHGYDGDDTILGQGAADELRGGAGDDSLDGGSGDDSLHGDAGDDTLDGGAGADSLYGHGGDDQLRGGDGADSLSAGQGDDTLLGGAGDDALHGYLGDDRLDGGAGHDTLFGGAGDDTLDGRDPARASAGTTDADYLNGGQGDDSIIAGGADIVTGGAGSDQISLGDWLSGGSPVEVLDFSQDEDSLLVLYDEAATPDPQLTVEQDEADSSLHRLVLNGETIAQVHSATALRVEDVALVPHGVP